MKELLECGHMPSEHSSFTNGYGIAKDGKRYCYDCCTKQDLAAMETETKHCAYISSDENEIQNWPGKTLAKITWKKNIRSGYCGKMLCWNAVDSTGTHWYGRSLGGGMYCTMHKTKNKLA